MRKLRKKSKKPKHPWDLQRIKEEKTLMKKYGLRRKKEIWKAEAILRNFRQRARELIATRDKEKENVLISKLVKMGLLSKDAQVEDVLGLSIEDVLDRRLQTIVFRSGLAKTLLNARQMIVHGHVFIGNKKIIFPSYFVNADEENKISIKGVEYGKGEKLEAKGKK
jgi:small subunit ribosomal protein S4